MPTKKAAAPTPGPRPRHPTGKGWEKGLEALAQRVTRWASGSQGFLFAVGTVALWLATGPFVRYSETWQLIINTRSGPPVRPHPAGNRFVERDLVNRLAMQHGRASREGRGCLDGGHSVRLQGYARQPYA